jgi:hypothetical protein
VLVIAVEAGVDEQDGVRGHRYGRRHGGGRVGGLQRGEVIVADADVLDPRVAARSDDGRVLAPEVGVGEGGPAAGQHDDGRDGVVEAVVLVRVQVGLGAHHVLVGAVEVAVLEQHDVGGQGVAGHVRGLVHHPQRRHVVVPDRDVTDPGVDARAHDRRVVVVELRVAEELPAAADHYDRGDAVVEVAVVAGVEVLLGVEDVAVPAPEVGVLARARLDGGLTHPM